MIIDFNIVTLQRVSKTNNNIGKILFMCSEIILYFQITFLLFFFLAIEIASTTVPNTTATLLPFSDYSFQAGYIHNEQPCPPSPCSDNQSLEHPKYSGSPPAYSANFSGEYSTAKEISDMTQQKSVK